MEFREIVSDQELDELPENSWVIDSECAVFCKDEHDLWEDNSRRFPKNRPRLPAYLVSGALV